MRSVYAALEDFDPLRRASCLQFSLDRSVPKEWFASFSYSEYGGHNSLDITATGLAPKSYGWIIANHVLEHIEDDRAAMSELSRILSDDGVLQITVPAPHARLRTNDWGYPERRRSSHFRHYGADFFARFDGILDGHIRVQALGRDPVSEVIEWIFFASRSEAVVANMYARFSERGLPASLYSLSR